MRSDILLATHKARSRGLKSAKFRTTRRSVIVLFTGIADDELREEIRKWCIKPVEFVQLDSRRCEWKS